jgi:hypothetical protein
MLTAETQRTQGYAGIYATRIMGEIILEIIFYGVGWLYLNIKFRDQGNMKVEMQKDYDDSFANAGKVICINVAYGLFGLVLFGAWLVGIIVVIRDAMS